MPDKLHRLRSLLAQGYVLDRIESEGDVLEVVLRCEGGTETILLSRGDAEALLFGGKHPVMRR